jgi:LPXTG-motif cell wall-anchored protein
MNKTTKYILAGALLLGGVAYFFYQNKKRHDAELEALRRKYNNQAPPSGTPDWMQWVRLIIAVYGQVNSLWEPGGLFYGKNVPRPGSDALDEILGRIRI